MCGFTPVKNSDWRIDPATEFSSLDAVDEVRTIAGGLRLGSKRLKLADQFI